MNKLRPFGPIETYIPVPYDLLECRIALAVDFAYGFNVGGLNTYEEIAQQDERIGIAALPRGLNGVNPAQISGLSMTAKSRHKVLAMELMRYLTGTQARFDSTNNQHMTGFYQMDLIVFYSYIWFMMG